MMALVVFFFFKFSMTFSYRTGLISSMARRISSLVYKFEKTSKKGVQWRQTDLNRSDLRYLFLQISKSFRLPKMRTKTVFVDGSLLDSPNATILFVYIAIKFEMRIIDKMTFFVKSPITSV